ncbi:MAG: HIT domain-containing protein, partial [Bacillota bacterium]
MAGCPFCSIISGEAPADILYEDDRVMAFKDTNPQAPVHFLVIPRKHIRSLAEMSVEDEGLLGHAVFVAGRVAGELGISERGFRLVANCR